MKFELSLATACASAAIGCIFLAACATFERTAVTPPAIEGATFVGNKACYDCHTNITRIFPASPHARLHFDGADLQGSAGCESCHGPGSKHVAVGGGRGQFIVNPGKDSSACLSCHLKTHSEFALPHHHPVLEDKMNCVQCHDPHGMDIMKPARGLAMARENETCGACHREQARSFVFEHEALREGCTVCHQPHGSINAKMLLERDNNLCLKCHVQMQGPGVAPGEIFIGKVPHAANLRMGTCWSAGCHSAVHGSNVDPRLFF